MQLIRILIVETDPVWQKCISNYLSLIENFQIIDCVDSKKSAIEQLPHADLVLMKLHHSDNKLDGIELAMEMNVIKPTKIILMTEDTKRETILKAYNAGAVHCLPQTNYYELPHIIRTVVLNGNPIEVLLEDYAKLKKDAILNQLSPSEREIFELLERGFTQISITQTLHKAESTVKNQVSSILKKMKVRTTKQAIEKIKSNYYSSEYA